jgi:hypothetical protein
MATNYFGLRKNPEFTNFRNYVLSFYAYDGLYPVEGLSVEVVERAIVKYIEICSSPAQPESWGHGDSLDRERVRDLIINPTSSKLKAKETV